MTVEENESVYAKMLLHLREGATHVGIDSWSIKNATCYNCSYLSATGGLGWTVGVRSSIKLPPIH